MLFHLRAGAPYVPGHHGVRAETDAAEITYTANAKLIFKTLAELRDDARDENENREFFKITPLGGTHTEIHHHMIWDAWRGSLTNTK